jgi:hypothetical protein
MNYWLKEVTYLRHWIQVPVKVSLLCQNTLKYKVALLLKFCYGIFKFIRLPLACYYFKAVAVRNFTEPLKSSSYFRPILPWNLRGKYHVSQAWNFGWFQSYAQKQAIQTFHGFPHYMQINPRLVLQIWQTTLRSLLSEIQFSLIALLFDASWCTFWKKRR